MHHKPTATERKAKAMTASSKVRRWLLGSLYVVSAVALGGFSTLTFLQAHATATISLVKEVGSINYANAAAISSATITVPAAGVAQGNTIVMTVGNSGNDGVTVKSVTDSRGNTYTVDANKSQISFFENTAVASGYMATALQPGDKVIVTLTGTATIFAGLASEWSGIASTGRVDKAATNIATSSSLSSGSVATTQASDVLIGSFIGNGNVTFTHGSNYIAFAAQFYNHVGSVYRDQWQEYRIVGQTGTYNATATTSSASGYAGAIVAYKAAPASQDTTPPSVPSGLAITASTGTTLGMNWTASSDNVGVAGYDLYLNGSKTGTTATTSANFTGLVCGTTYTLGVDAYDAAGNISAVADLNGATAQCDITPPTVSFAAPADGSTVSGAAVAVSANASDNVAVTSVQFKLDGNNLGPLLMVAPYTTTWDTTSVANGQHTITVIASDAAGNQASSAVTVTVNNVDSTP
ncbi:MAG TPA: Ig-like domain-containing protein, partial [Candidatus Acidoferrum sp.]|nr:Ig-like domain-containing protein [Candidatus Acidoferrum sp.]